MTMLEARNRWTAISELAHEKGLRYKPIRIDWTIAQIEEHTRELHRRVTGHDPGCISQQAWDIPGACDCRISR